MSQRVQPGVNLSASCVTAGAAVLSYGVQVILDRRGS